MANYRKAEPEEISHGGTVGCYLSVAQLQALSNAVKDTGMSRPEYVKQAVREALLRDGYLVVRKME